MRPPSLHHKLKSKHGIRSNSWFGSLCRLVPLLALSLYSFFLVSQLSHDSALRGGRREELELIQVQFPSKASSLLTSEERRKLPCSALINGEAGDSASPEGFLCCDRSSPRTDVCYMRGDIRTDPSSPSIYVHGVPAGSSAEKVKPYTRKFEDGIMNTINEISLVPLQPGNDTSGGAEECDVHHGEVPALVFSTGGYTGNVYHEFSDGLIPLYITSERFRGEVVLLVQEYHEWWASRYGGVLREMTNYPLIDLLQDRRVHCFREMIVGLKYHGELLINPALMSNGKGMGDFQALLHRGFSKSAQTAQQQEYDEILPLPSAPPAADYYPASRLCPNGTSAPRIRPKIVIFIRKQTRLILNLKDIVKACKRAGFRVRTFDARRSVPMYQIHDTLSSAQAMLAVHGAAVTHSLFLHPGSVLIQIVPLGLDWAADVFYGTPAKRLGLEYIEYKVAVEESSLSQEYERGSPELADPGSITKKGWWAMKKIYMDKQNVRVDLRRFEDCIHKAHQLILHNACSNHTATSNTIL